MDMSKLEKIREQYGDTLSCNCETAKKEGGVCIKHGIVYLGEELEKKLGKQLGVEDDK